MSRACGELPTNVVAFSAPSSSHLVICRDFLLAARAEPAALPAMGATTIIGYRGTRQEADEVDALARSCGCTSRGVHEIRGAVSRGCGQAGSHRARGG